MEPTQQTQEWYNIVFWKRTYHNHNLWQSAVSITPGSSSIFQRWASSNVLTLFILKFVTNCRLGRKRISGSGSRRASVEGGQPTDSRTAAVAAGDGAVEALTSAADTMAALSVALERRRSGSGFKAAGTIKPRRRPTVDAAEAPARPTAAGSGMPCLFCPDLEFVPSCSRLQICVPEQTEVKGPHKQRQLISRLLNLWTPQTQRYQMQLSQRGRNVCYFNWSGRRWEADIISAIPAASRTHLTSQ